MVLAGKLHIVHMDGRARAAACGERYVDKKDPQADLNTGQILKELPIIGMKYLTQLFNAILLLNHFPTQWKVAQIILILKPGKPPHDLSSYQPPVTCPLYPNSLKKVMNVGLQ
jgi:hypothetical protein